MTTPLDRLLDEIARVGCSGCDSAEIEMAAVYVPQHGRRQYGYGVCASCASDMDRVFALVERRVAVGEALELCTTSGGAA